MTIALVVPSVGRPKSLARTLRSVAKQSTEPDEVIVVAREDDLATIEVAEVHRAEVVVASGPGVALAMRLGAEHATSDVVAFTDDDAELTPEWTIRLKQLYADFPLAGAIGGSDILEDPDQRNGGTAVGGVTWYGRVLGNHHLGSGAPRVVDHLKGVNCSFRRDSFLSLDFLNRIEGAGAQTRNEFIASLGMRSLGQTCIYDPALQVRHYPQPRAVGDERGMASTKKAHEGAHNEVLAFRLYWRHRSPANTAFLALIGYGHAPGLGRLLRRAPWAKVRGTLGGIWSGWRA